jgi:NAD(P)-dependent dehydrogenase (short-subunit alcohol dehydrogenase family)
MKVEGTAAVTGTSRGLGRAIALELAARGFHVLATMRDPADGAELPAEAAAEGGSLEVAALDVGDPGSFEFPEDLKVLVNNAGQRMRNLPVEESTVEEWRAVFDVNVFGLMELTRRSLPALRQSRGVVCNVTSSNILGPYPFFSCYRASKWAASAMTESLRTEVAPFGIRVIEILPGPIDTDMLRSGTTFNLPAAAEFPLYREMAVSNFPSGKGVTDFITPPRKAAAAIADAILADGGPMRYGCDPLSVQAIEVWRHSSDEEQMRRTFERYGVSPP